MCTVRYSNDWQRMLMTKPTAVKVSLITADRLYMMVLGCQGG